jgi:hypothetical protein
MKTLHKFLIFSLSLMAYAHITQAMKLPSKMKRSFKNVGDKLLGKQSGPLFDFPGLPEDIQEYVVELMAKYSNAPSLREASKALKALSQTSTSFYKLINGTQFNEQLLFHLAQRFGCSMESAASSLATPAAQKYLNQNLIHLITSDVPQEIKAFFAISTNINAPLDDQGNTPLMIAIHHLAFNSIAALLNHKALDLTAENDNGDTILHIAFYKLFLLKAQDNVSDYVQLKKIVIQIINTCKTQKQINFLIFSRNNAGDLPSQMAYDLGDSNFFLQFGTACGET